MLADRKRVEEADRMLEAMAQYCIANDISRLSDESERAFRAGYIASLARAEAAEVALGHLRQRMAYWTSCALATVEGPKPRSIPMYAHKRFVSIAEKMVQDCRVNQVPRGLQGRLDDAYDAAHQPPAPVKAGGEQAA